MFAVKIYNVCQNGNIIIMINDFVVISRMKKKYAAKT